MKNTFWIKNIRLETGFQKLENGMAETLVGLFDIKIDDGQFAEIHPNGKYKDTMENPVNAGGLLMVPGFREMHCHLDKALMGHKWMAPIVTNSVLERAEFEKRIVPAIETTSIADRAENMIHMMLGNGSSFIRSHIDIYDAVGVNQLYEVQKAVEKNKAYAGFELVAFPQHGLLKNNCVGLIEKAMAEGADMVGGVDPTAVDGDMERSLNATFDIAVKYDAGIDYHLHEPHGEGIAAFHRIAELTEESGLCGRVFVSHGFALRDVAGAERDELAEKLIKAGVGLISHVPLNERVPNLPYYIEKGLDVALGSDNIYDCWSPFGNGDMLERLNRYSELFVLRTEDELRRNLGLITGSVTPLGDNHEPVWPKAGQEATFNLVEASCTAEMIARRGQRIAAYYKGKSRQGLT